MTKYEAEYIPDKPEDIEDIVYVREGDKLVAVAIPDDDADPVDEEG